MSGPGIAIDPATGRPMWTKADHDSARDDAWGAVLAGVPPFGDGPAEAEWLEIAAADRRRGELARQPLEEGT